MATSGNKLTPASDLSFATHVLECMSQVDPEGKYLLIEDSETGLKIVAAKTESAGLWRLAGYQDKQVYSDIEPSRLAVYAEKVMNKLVPLLDIQTKAGLTPGVNYTAEMIHRLSAAITGLKRYQSRFPENSGVQTIVTHFEWLRGQFADLQKGISSSLDSFCSEIKPSREQELLSQIDALKRAAHARELDLLSQIDALKRAVQSREKEFTETIERLEKEQEFAVLQLSVIGAEAHSQKEVNTNQDSQLLAYTKENKDLKALLVAGEQKHALALKEKEVLQARLVSGDQRLALTTREKDSFKAQLSASEAKLASALKEKEALLARLAAGEQQLVLKSKEKEALQARLAPSEEKLVSTTNEKASLQERLAASEQKLVLTARENASLQERLAASEEKLGATLKFIAVSERKMKVLSQMVAVMQKEKSEGGTL
jgi:hypothetical protein